MSIYAIDGSKYDLPATDTLRKEFDPKSGLAFKGKGHYPQCIVSTVYDVFKRIPIARTITERNGSEREEALKMIHDIPQDGVILFDRGYPSFEMFYELNCNYSGYYLFRSSATQTFKAIKEFTESDKDEETIWISPSKKFKKNVKTKKNVDYSKIKLRALKLRSPNGEFSILLTNLFCTELYSKQEIIDLYYKRYKIEEHYRDEKVIMEIEKFHSRTVNGIKQELFAALIMTIIPRTLMQLSQSNHFQKSDSEPQFKNAILTMAAEAYILVPINPVESVKIFEEILMEINRVRYYKPKVVRLSQPRICKKPPNKWSTQNRNTGYA